MTRRAGRLLAATFVTGIIVVVAATWPWTESSPARAPVDIGEPDGARPAREDNRTSAPRRTEDAPGARDGSRPTTPVVGVDRAALVMQLRKRKLVVPVAGVHAGELRSTFHDSRSGSRQHEALDILADRHTPVLAVEAGRIAKLFASKAGGLTIYQFDSSERFAYYYAHLERYADGLREGQWVSKGQPLGSVGTSGNAPPDTPHLHFAIFVLTPEKRWWNGVPIDPYEVWR